MEKTAQKATKTPRQATRQALKAKAMPAPLERPRRRARDAEQVAAPPAGERPQRRAGDRVQAWQQAKLDPGTWPLPAPTHGKAGQTWAILPTGEKVLWSDLGMDRRLEKRIEFWMKVKEAKKK